MERQKKIKGKVYFLKLKYLIKLIKKAGKEKRRAKAYFCYSGIAFPDGTKWISRSARKRE